MTQPSSLGTFVKQTVMGGDTYRAQDNVDKLLLVWVRERKEGMTTKHAKDGTGVGVIVDLVELLDKAYQPTGVPALNVLWMGTAVVDQLTPYVASGAPIPIMLQFQEPQGGGMAYIAPVAATDSLLKYASDWYGAYPTFLDDVKRKRVEEAKATAVAAGLPQAPAASQPTLGAGLAGPAPVPAVAAPAAAPAPAAVPVVAASVPAVPPAPQAAPFQQPVVAAPAPVVAVPAVAAPVVTAPPAPVVAAPVVAAPVPPAPPAPPAPSMTDESVAAMLAEVNSM